MRSELVLDGRFRVFEDGTINKVLWDGSEVPAKTCKVGRSDSPTKYDAVYYYVNGKEMRAYVHRLVATAFIPNPERRSEVSHIDGNKGNNNVSNLCWSTRSETTISAWRHGRINPYKNGEPCIFCGTPTRSKTGCCRECQAKHTIVTHRMEKLKRQRDKYEFFDTSVLTDREAQCVGMAKRGDSKTVIARELGISKQRVDQILDRAEEKQKGLIAL